jgi:O-antigen ligase
MSDATIPAAHSSASAARTTGGARTHALWAAAALLFAAPALLAFRSGDSAPFQREQMLALVLALALLAALALVAPWPLVERGPALWSLGALTAFAGWTALSLLWTRTIGDAKHDLVRALLYLAVYAAALIVMRMPAIRRAAAPALLAGIALVALYGLGRRLLPDLEAPLSDLLPGLVSYVPGFLAGSRLDAPLSYWNAMGLLMALGCLLALALAGDEERRPGARSLACAVAVPCAVAVYLTLSRGAVLALAVGLVVLLLVRPRGATAVATGAAMAAAGLAILALQALPAVRDLGRPESDRAGEGLVALVLLAIAAAGAAALQRRLSGSALSERDLPLRGRTSLAASLATVLAVGAVGALIVGSTERPTQFSGSQARLASTQTLRGDYWSVAAGTISRQPLAGVGAASFQVEWRRERDRPDFAFQVHSLYLETAAELGLAGLLLLTAFFATVIAGLARRPRGDPILAATAPVLAAFAVHAGLDWDWEWPALMLPALLLAAAAVQPEPRARRRWQH